MHATDTIASCLTKSPLEFDTHSAEDSFQKEAIESILFFLEQENNAIDQLIEKMKNTGVSPQI
jgi:hypothetical protein